MKRTNFIGLIALFVIVLIGCSKQDFKNAGEEVPAVKLDKKLKGCTPASFYGNWEEYNASFNPFRKTFDEFGRVNMVVAPVFSLFLMDSLFLSVKYEGNKVYFVNQKDLTDTVSIALFDKQGRLQVMYESGNPHFLTTEFYYTKNRLSSKKAFWTLHSLINTMEFKYDTKGNVVKYIGTGGDDQYGYEFTYDLNNTIKQQFYVEYSAAWIDNTFILAQIMGWTPDLDPVNKRINTMVYLNTSFSNATITDHVVDADGNLISYKQYGFQMNLSWTCRKGNVIN